MNAADFADLACDLDPVPAFHVDETDRDPASEDDRQAAFVAAIRKTPGLAVQFNANERRWGLKAWNRAKKLGAYWGWPDTVVVGPGLVAFLEWKNGTKQPEDHQIRCLNRLHAMGFPVGVFRRADSALAFLARHGFAVGVRDAA